MLKKTGRREVQHVAKCMSEEPITMAFVPAFIYIGGVSGSRASSPNNSIDMETINTIENLIERRPITGTLRAMEIGQTEVFPVSQLISIQTAIQSRLLKERAEGRKFKTRRNFENNTVEVTRTA